MQAGSQGGLREQACDEDYVRQRGGVRIRDQTAVQPRHQAAVQQRGGEGAKGVKQTGECSSSSVTSKSFLINNNSLLRFATLAMRKSASPSPRGCRGLSPARSAVLRTSSIARSRADQTVIININTYNDM